MSNSVTQDLDVADFMSMFNLDKQQNFKTDITKTHGQLTLKNGKLVNVNRHGGSRGDARAEKSPETVANYEIRAALVKALKKGGVRTDSAFFKDACAKLGVNAQNPDGQGLTAKPLSRRVVKEILQGYQIVRKWQKVANDFLYRNIAANNGFDEPERRALDQTLACDSSFATALLSKSCTFDEIQKILVPRCGKPRPTNRKEAPSAVGLNDLDWIIQSYEREMESIRKHRMSKDAVRSEEKLETTPMSDPHQTDTGDSPTGEERVEVKRTPMPSSLPLDMDGDPDGEERVEVKWTPMPSSLPLDMDDDSDGEKSDDVGLMEKPKSQSPLLDMDDDSEGEESVGVKSGEEPAPLPF